MINYLNRVGPDFGYFVLLVSGVLVIALIVFLLHKWESKRATNKYSKMHEDNIS